MVEYHLADCLRTLTPAELTKAKLLTPEEIKIALQEGTRQMYLAREAVIPHGSGNPRQLYR